MAEEKTNEAIKRFKSFLRDHPEIVNHVRSKDKKWSDVFDDWVIFGESHEIWKTYGVDIEKKKKETRPVFNWNNVLKAVDKIDTKQWQERLDTLSGALTGIQTFIGQFRQDGGQNGQPGQNSGQNVSGAAPAPPASDRTGDGQRPFFFRRD
ncbi:spore coat protein YlbD [Sporolactobacillus putidus]|uniref:Coat protein n=1 Tax=Sporolactobacillus putidus TaxID=492735 RepID=A0A917VYH2_9BACL|nr:spore coat protein YlbD [Sporolactobacillus putidus]GGL44936.1 hypothetical protein GCM10007968_06230 [Sporolactobacillus putidus]